MTHPYLSLTEPDRDAMLATIGVDSIEELFRDIPATVRFDRELALDPPLTELGDNCIVGHDAVLFCHAIEGRDFSLAGIRIGHNVPIGATAVIMSGVKIGDGAIVSAGAVVLKDAAIGPGAVWGGVQARVTR